MSSRNRAILCMAAMLILIGPQPACQSEWLIIRRPVLEQAHERVVEQHARDLGVPARLAEERRVMVSAAELQYTAGDIVGEGQVEVRTVPGSPLAEQALSADRADLRHAFTATGPRPRVQVTLRSEAGGAAVPVRVGALDLSSVRPAGRRRELVRARATNG